MRGYAKEGVVEAVRARGGEVYAVSSEPHSLARSAQSEWNTGMEHVGDPHQEISGACAERGWLALFTNDWGDEFVGETTRWVSHPKGYFQPGVLAVSREGRVLYRWRCRPTRQNIGGATGRPTASHVWGRVQTALDEPLGAPDAPPDADPVSDGQPAIWPVFVALLVANGWFLRPVPFNQGPGKNTPSRQIRNAALRIPLFVTAWITAGLLLPAWAVAATFAGWVFWIVPGVRQVQRLFQNVAANEEPAAL